MMVVGLWNKKDLREPARTNRRRAASWGLTLLLVELALVAIQIAVFTIVLRYQDSAPFNPWGARSWWRWRWPWSTCWCAPSKRPGLPRQDPPLRRPPLLPLTTTTTPLTVPTLPLHLVPEAGGLKGPQCHLPG